MCKRNQNGDKLLKKVYFGIFCEAQMLLFICSFYVDF